MRKIVLVTGSMFSFFCFKVLKSNEFKDDKLQYLAFSKFFYDKAKNYSIFDKIDLIPEELSKKKNRFSASKGRELVSYVRNYIEQEKPDIFFFPNLLNEHHNFFIDLIRNNHSKAQICTIPEGFSLVEDRLRFGTKIERLLKGKLTGLMWGVKYYKPNKLFSGWDMKDEKGSYIVHKNYFPNSFLNNCPEENIHYFNYSKPENKNSCARKSAIFIGQCIVDSGDLPIEQAKKNTQEIINYLKANGAEEFYIAPHHYKKCHDDFIHPELIEIQQNQGEFLEEHVLKTDYKFVISYYSTVMLAAAFNEDHDKKFISLGLKQVGVAKKEIESYENLFKHLGIEFFSFEK